VRELARLTGAAPGSLHRELRTLAAAGLLLREETGRQVYYRANVQSPVFADLASFLRKTAGLADVLREALEPLAAQVKHAFVYGSMARGEEHPHSDVDVMVIGDVDFADVVMALAPAQEKLRREINPTVLSPREWARKLKQGDGFATKVWKGSKIWLVDQIKGRQT
jgi:predicted nucleotidyltransferase